MRSRLSILFALVFALLIVPAAEGQQLFSDFPIDGQISAFQVSGGDSTSNSFTLASTGTVGEVVFGAWVNPGDSVIGATWSIGTTPFDTSLGTGVAGATSSYDSTNVDGFDVDTVTFAISGVTLPAGTYYLTISNAVSASGNPVGGDINNAAGVDAWSSAYGHVSAPNACYVLIGISGTCASSFELEGTSMALTAMPSSVSFANQSVNTTSTSQPVTITNTGSGTATISGIAITGTNPGDFAQTNNCPLSPATLAASGTCTINVTFTPLAANPRAAAITLTGSSPISIPLSGTGTQVPSTVTVLPTSITFPNQALSTTSGTQGITVTNSGPSPLTINSIAIIGTNPVDFAQNNNCPISPATIAVNGTCIINVTFTPLATGARSAAVSITDNGNSSPQSVPVSGTGLPAPATWPNGYLYQATFTVAAGQVPSAQTNFPALISGTWADFATTANGGRINNACTQVVGNNSISVPCDLIFTSDAAGAQLLSWEFESWNPATGAANIWVNVPNLANGAVIYAWYGQASVSTLQTTPSATWTNYMAVYHMKENPAGAAPQLNDSTGSGNSATMNGPVLASQQQAGEIGGSINFEGDTWASLPSSSAFNFERTDSFSLSGWFNIGSNTIGSLLTKVAQPINGGWTLMQFAGASSPQISLGLWGANASTGAYVETPQVSMGVWHYVVATYSGTGTTAGMNIYIDGVNQTLTTKENNLATSILNSSTPAINSRSTDAQNSNDAMDELRVSAKGVVYPAAWVTATYNNESNPSSFFTVATGLQNPNGSTVSLSPSTVSFPSTGVGTTSSALAATLSNTGSATLNNIVPSITGTNPGDFAITTGANACGATLAAGSSCSIYVTFTPASAAGFSATLSVADSSTGSPQTASLTGTGIVSKLLFTTGPQSTGTVGAPMSSVVVEVQDGNGNLETGSSAQVTISSTPAGISGTLTATAVNGMATFSNLMFNAAGTYTLSAAANGLTGVTSGSITINATRPTGQYFFGTELNSLTPTASQSWIGLTPLDENLWETGSPTGDQFALMPTTGTFSSFCVNLITAPGVGASWTWTLYKNGSDQSISVTISGAQTVACDSVDTTGFVPGDLVSLHVTPSASPAPAATYSRWYIEQTPQVPGETIMFASQLLGSSKYLALGINSEGNATETGIATIIPAAGTVTKYATEYVGAGATVTSTLDQNESPSPFSATLTTSGVLTEQSGNLSVSPGDVFDTNESGITTGSGFYASIVFVPSVAGQFVISSTRNAEVNNQATTYFDFVGRSVDQFQPTESLTQQIGSNLQIQGVFARTTVAPGSGTQWAYTLRDNGANTLLNTVTSGTNLTSCTTSAPVTGCASGSPVTVNNFDLMDTAATPTGSPAVSNGNNGVAVSYLAYMPQLAFSTEPPATGTAGTALSPVVVQVEDANGNPLTGSTASVTISSAPAGVGGTLTVNAVNGVATFSNLQFTNTGSYTLSASTIGLATVTSSPITISGGSAPVATLSPALSFPNTTPGTTSAALAATLSNTGSGELNNIVPSITGTNPGDFALTTGANACGATLAAGSSCSIYVTFTPASAASFSATLSVADSASGSPQTVSLTGTGTAPVATLSPALSFPNTLTGTTSSALAATLSNTGTAPLNNILPSITGTNPGDFAITTGANACAATLAAGSSCSIYVTFTPASATSFSATLSVADNASGSPQTSVLSGTGITSGPTTWPNGYNYEATFTVASGQVPSAQTNFPALISGTWADFATTANGGRINNACTQVVGNNSISVPCDLIFTSDAAGTQLLSWEFETWNPATGAANIWVNVPNLANGTVIYAWYGQASVSTLQTTPSATWTNYMAVYHMKENPAGTAPQLNDSTGSGNNATMNGPVLASQQQTGEIGGSINFEGDTWASLASSSAFNFERTDSFSLSGWFNIGSNTIGSLLTKVAQPINGGWTLMQFAGASSPQISLGLWGANASTGAYVETPQVSMGVWHYVVATYSGTGTTAGMNIYIDGVNQTLTTKENNLATSILNSSTPAINSRSTDFQNSNDAMDELRISAKGVVYPAAWVTASYNNESRPATFFTVATGLTNP